MEVRLLGPLEVVEAERLVEVPGAKQRALLAMLALAAPRPVSDARLLDELWGEELPGTPGNALQKRVSELRKCVGTATVVRRGNGYALDIEPTDVDSLVFESTVAAARRSIGDGDVAAAAARLRDALAMWRGPALADLLDHRFAELEATRLEDLRLDTIEARVDCELELDRHGELTTELTALVAAHPLRERFRAQLMVALYRSGRQTDALRTYDDARRALADVGLEPGPALRALETAVLAHDPSLSPPTARAVAPSPPQPSAAAAAATAPALPAPASTFVGRARERVHLRERLLDHRLVTVTGPGGAGKTRLAVEVAVDLQRTTAVWLAELAPVRPGYAVVEAVADAVGARETGATGSANPLDRVVAQLADQTGILLIDNCEHVLADAAALASRVLAGCAGVRVLATSREPLTVTGEAQLPLGALEPDDAERLFVARATSARADFQLDARTAPVVRDICRALDGLPLAIELAAARVKALDVTHVARRLDDRFRLLTGGSRTALPRQQTLRATVEWSYDLLFEHERMLFMRASVFAGTFDLDAAVAICATSDTGAASDGLDEIELMDLLSRLVDKSLLEVRGSRYRMLETLRQFAAEQLEAFGDAEAVRRTHAEYFGHVALFAGGRAFAPDQVRWLDRLEDDHDNLRAAIDWSLEHAPRLATSITSAVAPAWWLRGHGPEARFVLDAALARDQTVTASRAIALRWASQLVDATGWSRLPVAAERELDQALRRAEEAAWTAERAGDTAEVGHAERQCAIAMLRHATYRGMRDGVIRAREHLQRSNAVFTSLDDAWGIAFGTVIEAFTYVTEGDLDGAEPRIERAAAAAERSGDRVVTERVMLVRALIAELRGDTGRAISLHRDALALCEEVGSPEAAAVHRLYLAVLGEAVDEPPMHATWWAAPDELAIVALTRTLAANLAFQRGDLRRAVSMHEDALARYRALGITAGIASSERALADLATAHERA